MPIHNSDIADIFNEIADLLEIEEADQFRIRAYRRAAMSVENLSNELSGMVAGEEDLTQLPGIGKSIAEKIKEIVETGKLKQLEEIKKKTPAGLGEMMKIGGLGPKRVEVLHEKLHVDSLADLRKAVKKHEIRELEGFGEKTEEKIKEELERGAEQEKRTSLYRAEEFAKPLVKLLSDIRGVDKVIVAGSYRRRKETVGDLDILVTCKNSSKVMDVFTSFDDVEKVLSKGSTRASVRLRSGLQVDLRVVEDKSYGAALQYFTGSKDHNIKLRERAMSRKLKINEYGVFPEGKEKSIAGATEEEVYKAVDLPYIEPELRENMGEIEAAEKKKLPELITLHDIKGDLHTHSKYSDGTATIREMTKAAQEHGYEYIGITDHSKRVTIARGMDDKRLSSQLDEIDKVQEDFDNFTILKGCEVDILDDGSLDMPDSILKRLDYTVCSIHYKFNLSRKDQTNRVMKAMDNPYFTILGHPTGRQTPERGEMELDMEKLMEAALKRGCFMELNSTPKRLDLRDIYCKMAKDRGLKLSISTDAHSPNHLDFIRYGMDQARRGWLEADDVLNTRSVKELKKLFKR